MSVESPDTEELLPGDGALEADPDGEIVFSEADAEPDLAPPSMDGDLPGGDLGGVSMPEETASPEMLAEPMAEMPSASTGSAPAGDGLNAVLQIPITVEIVLGTASMTVSELAALGKGSKIPLDRKVGEPVDVVVNGRVIAHGSVVMLDDGTDRFGISLESLAGPGSNAQGAVRSA